MYYIYLKDENQWVKATMTTCKELKQAHKFTTLEEATLYAQTWYPRNDWQVMQAVCMA